MPVLEMVENSKGDDGFGFYNNYVLLLWLSIIVYMPFNIADFDAIYTTSAAISSTANKSVVDR